MKMQYAALTVAISTLGVATIVVPSLRQAQAAPQKSSASSGVTQVEKAGGQGAGLELPQGCTFRRVSPRRVEFSCPDGSRGHLIMTASGQTYLRFLSHGQSLQVVSIVEQAPGKFTSQVLGTRHVDAKQVEDISQEKRKQCLHAREWCLLTQYIYQHPNEDAWPAWVDYELGLPMCPGELEGDCDVAPHDGSLCSMLDGGCKDKILPLIGHAGTQQFFCAAHALCDL